MSWLVKKIEFDLTHDSSQCKSELPINQIEKSRANKRLFPFATSRLDCGSLDYTVGYAYITK